MIHLKKLSIISLCFFLISCNTGIGNIPPLPQPENNPITASNQNFNILNNQINPNSDWMASMSDIIGNKTLRNIVIPGTHDSGTHSISEISQMSPDNTLDATIAFLENIKEKIHNLFFNDVPDSKLKKIIAPWAKAQSKSILEQLESGIRYFDLRVLRRSDGQMFIVHGMYSDNIDTVFSEIKSFTDNHPKEIIILDFNHLFHLQSNQEDLIAKINNSFSAKLIPATKTVNATLNELWQSNKQIIALYDDNESVIKHQELWSQAAIFSPWPNKQDINNLKQSLQNILDGKLYNNKKQDFDCISPTESCQSISKNKFFVLQGVLTPNAKLILDSYSSTEDLENAKGNFNFYNQQLESVKTKLSEATIRYNKTIFFLKPFYKPGINRLKSEKNFKEIQLLGARLELTKAQAKYDTIPHSLQQLAATTTPFINGQLKNEWAAKDLNIVIVDWFEITDYLETIKKLNRSRN
jgi:hypothetical protein